MPNGGDKQNSTTLLFSAVLSTHLFGAKKSYIAKVLNTFCREFVWLGRSKPMNREDTHFSTYPLTDIQIYNLTAL
jgi:hypothetical protein